MPSIPSQKTALEFFARNGYWAILPRYRGSWESDGTFLKKSPEEDIRDIIDSLPKGIKDEMSEEVLHVEPNALYVVGVSFGGPAALLVSRDTRVNAVVAISSVVDWQVPSKEEPLDWLAGFVKRAFGEGYRFTRNEWKKLSRGTFYNPVKHTSELDGENIYIIHAENDEVVPVKPVKRFAKKIGARTKFYKRGGHLSLKILMKPALWRQVERFFKERS